MGSDLWPIFGREKVRVDAEAEIAWVGKCETSPQSGSSAIVSIHLIERYGMKLPIRGFRCQLRSSWHPCSQVTTRQRSVCLQ